MADPDTALASPTAQQLRELVMQPIARVAEEQARRVADIEELELKLSADATQRQQELEGRELERHHEWRMFVAKVSAAMAFLIVGAGVWMLVSGNPLGWSLVALVVGGAGGAGAVQVVARPFSHAVPIAQLTEAKSSFQEAQKGAKIA